MSAVAESSTRAPRPAPRPRPRLVSDRRAQIDNAGFVALLVSVLAVGMFGLLMIQTAVQRQSFELDKLETQAQTLVEREDALRTQVDATSSSAELMRRASELGMVPVGSPGYVQLGKATVQGTPKPATSTDLRTLRTRNQQLAEAKAKRDADAKAKAEAAAQKRADAEKAAREKAQATPAPATPGASPSAAPTPSASPSAPAATKPTPQPTRSVAARTTAVPTPKATASAAATTRGR